jgi:hypothetical protein
MLRRRWLHFWFEPVSPTNLCVSRMLLFGLMFLFYLTVDFGSYATAPLALWKPIRLFEWLHLPLLPEGQIDVMEVAWKAALLFACVGLFTRTAVAVAFVLGVYLLGLPHNWGKVNHSDTVLIFSMGILLFSHCGDAFSLDRLLWNRGAALEPAQPSPEYKWPVRMIWLVGCLIFFGAGMSKMMGSGVHWVTSGQMAGMLIQHHYSHSPPTRLGLHIAQHPSVAMALGASTLVIELLLPLSLFSLRARRVLVPGMFFAQVGIGVFMGVWFTQFLIYYVFWLPWDRIGSFASRWFHGRQRSPQVEAASIGGGAAAVVR